MARIQTSSTFTGGAALALILALPAVARADVVPPDCVPRFPAEEMDSCGRDRAVVVFHNACMGAFKVKGCDLRSNPGLMNDCGQLKACMEDGGTKRGSIAGHVLEWQLKHWCEGDANCIAVHKDLCLGKGNGLQQRRRLLRCSQKARNKLNGWSAQLFQTRTGNSNQSGGWALKFGRDLEDLVAEAPPGVPGGPPGEPGQKDPPSTASGSEDDAPGGPTTLSAEELDRRIGLCVQKGKGNPDATLACLEDLQADVKGRKLRAVASSRTRR